MPSILLVTRLPFKVCLVAKWYGACYLIAIKIFYISNLLIRSKIIATIRFMLSIELLKSYILVAN